MAALTRAVIQGRFALPDDADNIGATARFTLSGYDTEGADVIPPVEINADLAADGALPDGFEIWRNTEGLRGTYYALQVTFKVRRPNGLLHERTIPLANIQVGAAASYDIADLLNTPVPDAPGWNVNLDPAALAALQADIAATAVARDEAEAARDEVAANLANLLFVVAEDDIGVTLAIGAAVAVEETDDPYPSITLEFLA